MPLSDEAVVVLKAHWHVKGAYVFSEADGRRLTHSRVRDVVPLTTQTIPNRLVIQRSTLDFQEPVGGDFTAISTLPVATEWDRFLSTLARHDRARVSVPGAIHCASGIGASHEGVYVALRIAGQ